MGPLSVCQIQPTLRSCVHACGQLFCNARRAEVKAANPSAGFKEMSSLLATAWKDAGEAERAPFLSLHQARCQNPTCMPAASP